MGRRNREPIDLDEVEGGNVPMKISTVSEFLECLGDEGASPPECLYRGQADSEWRVDCSAIRRLEASTDQEMVLQLSGHLLMGYLDVLLREGSRYIGTCPELPSGSSELDLLAQLQHQGAATGLIDFTLNPLVALWFACTGNTDKDGAVCVLSRSNAQEIDENEVRVRGLLNWFYQAGKNDWNEPLYMWTPKAMHGRPSSQQAVFVFGVPFIWPSLLKRVVIDKSAKESLTAELRASHNISKESLFADFAGYAQSNSVSKSFDVTRTVQFWAELAKEAVGEVERSRAYANYGMACSAIRQHDSAREQYTQALSINSDNIVAYANRAKEKRLAGDLAGSLEDYNEAIRICTESQRELDRQHLGKLFWERGETYLALDKKEQGFEDLNHSIELGHKMYHYQKGDERAKISHHPASVEEYQPLTSDKESQVD